MVPQTILIGLVVAIVGYFLQQRSWRHSKREEIRQQEFDACMAINDALARAFDKRITATSEFISLVQRGDVTVDDRQAFQLAIKDWMHDFSSFKSKIYHYFGKGRMLEFEESVHASLRDVSDIILRTDRLGEANLSADHLQESKSCFLKLDFARYNAYRFLAELNEMTASEQTGRIALYDNIRIGNLDMMSRMYLIQRLLGMRS